jgi:hypothetical protein
MGVQNLLITRLPVNAYNAADVFVHLHGGFFQ